MSVFVQTILQNCQQVPCQTAYICQHDHLTYGELYQRATRLAGFLQAQGDSPVLVYGHKQSNMLVAFLACLICGRAYVPCDPDFPLSRVQDIANQSGAGVVVALQPLALKGPLLLSAQTLEDICAQERPWTLNTDMQRTAYILFTSGSTGTPKGVPITKENLAHFIDWVTRLPAVRQTHSAVVFNQALFSFDLSMADIFISLMQQNTLVAASRAQQSDFTRLFEALGQSGCTIIVCTPTFMQLCLCDQAFGPALLKNLRAILFCGEALPKKVVQKLFNRFEERLQMLNLYGPTEATVAVSCANITQEMLALPSLPIGQMEQNAVEIQVVDETLCPVREGALGEILLCGKSVFHGYLGNVQGGFFIKEAREYYLTGDLGKIQNGLLFYMGRKDRQVKFKGYRIELGEIESALQSLPWVQQAAVVPLQNATGAVMRLAAAVTLCAPCTPQQLKTALKPLLPGYMLPNAVYILDQMPINANGKCDIQQIKEAILCNKKI